MAFHLRDIPRSRSFIAYNRKYKRHQALFFTDIYSASFQVWVVWWHFHSTFRAMRTLWISQMMSEGLKLNFNIFRLDPASRPVSTRSTTPASDVIAVTWEVVKTPCVTVTQACVAASLAVQDHAASTVTVSEYFWHDKAVHGKHAQPKPLEHSMKLRSSDTR